MTIPSFNQAPSNPTPAAKSIFDSRLLTVEIALPSGTISLSNLAIYASGRKYASALNGECTARIFNLTRAQQNELLTQTSPLKFPRVPINMNVLAGRQSYGTFLLFSGNIIASDITQPPDIGVTLQSLSQNFQQGILQGYSSAANSTLASIAQNIAGSFNPPLTLQFETQDKMIKNFSYTGTPLDGLRKLEQMGGVDAYIDDASKTLIVVSSGQPRAGSVVQINEQNGMVGIPRVTAQGVIVTVMLNSQIVLGGSVQITSIMNPAANGTYKVAQINFEVANRDQPFYFILFCTNLAYLQGTT